MPERAAGSTPSRAALVQAPCRVYLRRVRLSAFSVDGAQEDLAGAQFLYQRFGDGVRLAADRGQADLRILRRLIRGVDSGEIGDAARLCLGVEPFGIAPHAL